MRPAIVVSAACSRYSATRLRSRAANAASFFKAAPLSGGHQMGWIDVPMPTASGVYPKARYKIPKKKR